MGPSPTYYCVIHEQLDKVEDHEDGDEGVEVNIKAEAPLHVLITEIGLEKLVGDVPETSRNH